MNSALAGGQKLTMSSSIVQQCNTKQLPPRVRDLDGTLLRQSGIALPAGGLLPASCDAQTSKFVRSLLGQFSPGLTVKLL